MDFATLIKYIVDVGFTVVCSAVFITLVVRMFNKQQKWLEKFVSQSIENNKTKSHPDSEDVEVLDIINRQMTEELRGLLVTLKSDRAYVFLYHNGGMSTSGLYFQKMSCVCEVVGQGVLPLSGCSQQLYRASYAYLCERLKQFSYVEVNDRETVKSTDGFMYNEFVSRHSHSSYFRAIKDADNRVIGFVGVDYCSLNTEVPTDLIRRTLKVVSHKLSPLVDIRDEVSH